MIFKRRKLYAKCKKRTDEFSYKPFAFEIAYFKVEGQRGGKGSHAKIGDFDEKSKK